MEIDKATPSPAYTLKVRGGVSVDSKGKAAGKGALIQTEKAGCIGAAQDQYLFQPVKIEVSKPKNE